MEIILLYSFILHIYFLYLIKNSANMQFRPPFEQRQSISPSQNIKQKSLENKLKNRYFLLCIQKKFIIQMSFYQTPIKGSTKKQQQIYTQDRPTDWICVICNNLNFSFRKKCNRCKTQTRSENQNLIANANVQARGNGNDHVQVNSNAYGYSDYDYYYRGGNYMTVGKYPLGEITNCYTPDDKASMVASEYVQDFNLGVSEQKYSAKLQPRCIISPNILDNQYWQNINAVPQDEYPQPNPQPDHQQTHSYQQNIDQPQQEPTHSSSSRLKNESKNSFTNENTNSNMSKTANTNRKKNSYGNGNRVERLRSQEKSVCQFTDLELEYLINKVLVED